MKTIIDEVRDNLTDNALARIALFARRSVFLPENTKLKELRELIMKEIFGDFSDIGKGK